MTSSEEDIPLSEMIKVKARRKRTAEKVAKYREKLKSDVKAYAEELKKDRERKRCEYAALKCSKEKMAELKRKKTEAQKTRRAIKKQTYSRQKLQALRKKERERKKTTREKQRATKQRERKGKMLAPDTDKAASDAEKEPLPGTSSSGETKKRTRKGQCGISRTTLWRKKKEIEATLTKVGTPRKQVKALRKVVCSAKGKTKELLSKSIVLTDEALVEGFKNLKESCKGLSQSKKGDPGKAKRVLALAFAGGNLQQKKLIRPLAKQLGIDRRQLAQCSKEKVETPNLLDLVWCRIKRKRRSDAVSDDTCLSVTNFYLRSDITRVLPTKKDVVRIKAGPGNYQQVPKRILEMSLTEAYRKFKSEHPTVKLGQRKFEQMKPPQVRSPRLSDRQVCGCTYHFRMHYIIQALNKVLRARGKGSTVFANTCQLINVTLCVKEDGKEFHKMSCISRDCAECGTGKLEELFTHDCTKCDCTTDAQGQKMCHEEISWQSYEYVEITPGVKRLQFVSKRGTVTDLLIEAMKHLKPFAKHHFMATWVFQQYTALHETLAYDEILFILDFAENYSCKVFREVQSMHWVTLQVTLFIGVCIRHSRGAVDGGNESTEEEPVVIEDHFIVIFEENKHDVWAVRHGRKLMINFLIQDVKFTPTKVYEVCDGAASQFKCSTSLLHISQHEKDHYGIPVERMWWETAHGKGKADGVGGVVKNQASLAVVRQEEDITDARKMYDWCVDNLTEVGSSSTYMSRINGGKCVRRKFFYVPAEGTGAVERPSDFEAPKTVKGTRSLHQARSMNKEGHLQVRNIPCYCDPCKNGALPCDNAEYTDSWHNVTLEGSTGHQAEEEEEMQEEDFSEVQIQEEAIVVLRAEEELADYYLVKVVTVETLNTEEKDSYGHRYSAATRVIKGHYLELVPRQQNVYYIDKTKDVIIPTFLVISQCPDLNTDRRKVKRKEMDVYTVDLETHEILLSLTA